MSARHKWTRLVLFGTHWLKAAGRAGDRRLEPEDRFVPLWTFAISRCKTRKIQQTRLVFIFLHFSLGYEMYSRHQIGSESKEEFEEKSSNGQTKLFDQRNRLVPRGAVESLTISDWSVGGSNPSTCVSFSFFFFFFSFFVSVSKVLFFFFTDCTHSSWQERGTTFDWISCWIKFTTMVSVWEGEFQ